VCCLAILSEEEDGVAKLHRGRWNAVAYREERLK
jgi:hypothetical protein